jgi:hypothetical protein
MGIPVNCNDSASVWTLSANPITGTVRVRWFNAPTICYRHEGISRRAILSLLWDSNRSLGQWVNRHCLQSHVTLTA